MSGHCRSCGYDGCVCNNDLQTIPNDLSMNDNLDKKLPSRRYTCETCGRKGRRSNAKQERNRPAICPPCEKYKLYREYVQPSSILLDKDTMYKSLLIKYQDLIEENKNLENSLADLQFQNNQLQELSQAIVNR